MEKGFWSRNLDPRKEIFQLPIFWVVVVTPLSLSIAIVASALWQDANAFCFSTAPECLERVFPIYRLAIQISAIGLMLGMLVVALHESSQNVNLFRVVRYRVKEDQEEWGIKQYLKKIFTIDAEKPFYTNYGFLAILSLTFLSVTILALPVAFRELGSLSLSSEGYKNFVNKMSFPLTILSIGSGLTVVFARFHRSKFLDEQRIEGLERALITKKASDFNLRTEHQKQFLEYVDSIPNLIIEKSSTQSVFITFSSNSTNYLSYFPNNTDAIRTFSLESENLMKMISDFGSKLNQKILEEGVDDNYEGAKKEIFKFCIDYMRFFGVEARSKASGVEESHAFENFSSYKKCYEIIHGVSKHIYKIQGFMNKVDAGKLDLNDDNLEGYFEELGRLVYLESNGSLGS